MYADEFDMLRGIASRERLDPYLRVSLGDRSAAVRLYAWNIQVSAAFRLHSAVLKWSTGMRCTIGSQLCSAGTTGGWHRTSCCTKQLSAW